MLVMKPGEYRYARAAPPRTAEEESAILDLLLNVGRIGRVRPILVLKGADPCPDAYRGRNDSWLPPSSGNRKLPGKPVGSAFSRKVKTYYRITTRRNV